MTDRITATVSVPFGDAQAKPNIQIEPHPSVSITDPGIPLRCFPPGCTFACSVGQVRLKEIREVEIQGQMVHWQGTSTKLKYYPVSTPTVELVYGFRDDNGQVLAGATFTTDLVTGEIKSNVSFQGLVKVGLYNAQYQLFTYEPLINYLGAGWAGFDGLSVTFGAVAAYKDGSLTIYDVPAPTFPNTDDFVEIYRIVSQTIITVDGEWEKPQTWDGSYTGTYTTGQTGPEKDNSAVKERVHEVGGIMKSSGIYAYTRYTQSLAKPFNAYLIHGTGTQDFQPVISFKGQDVNTVFADNLYIRGLAAGYISLRQTQPLVP